jgi:branched-chain amino acid transport system substrate-binding protein
MEGKMKRFWVIAVVTGAAAVLAASFGGFSSASTSAKGPIAIGALTSLTGNFTPWGIQVRDGMSLAVKQINAKGGVKGRKLKLVIGDDRSTPTAGIDEYRRLTQQEKVVAVGGLISSDVALATARLTEQAKVPMFLIKAGATQILTTKSRYTFRTCLPAAAEVAAPIRRYAEQRKFTRIGAIIADYAWGQSIKASLNRVFRHAKKIKVNIQTAPVSTRDFTTYLRNLSSFKPQLIVATGHPPGSGAILAQSGQLGMRVPVAGAYTPWSLIAKAAGTAAYGRYSDFKCQAVGSKGYRTLARQFLRANPNDTFFEDDALAGYAIVKIVAQAVGKVGDNPKKIAAYIHAHTFKIPGYTFPLSWTKWGELKRAQIAFDLLTRGPAPKGLNTGGSWYPKQLSLSKPLVPAIP